MSPARRARLSNIGRWTCLAAALLFAALSLAGNWWWLKCWGTVGGWRLSSGVDRGDAYIFLSKDWPQRPFQPQWYLAAEPRLQYGYSWWGWFWPWNPLTSGSAWFRQFAFPSWLPIPILALAAGALWRTHARALNTMTFSCPSCDYDRQGLALSTPCPECGAAPNPAQAT